MSATRPKVPNPFQAPLGKRLLTRWAVTLGFFPLILSPFLLAPFALGLPAMASPPQERPAPGPQLRFDEPAEYFEETLLLGNGRVGASFFGGEPCAHTRAQAGSGVA